MGFDLNIFHHILLLVLRWSMTGFPGSRAKHFELRSSVVKFRPLVSVGGITVVVVAGAAMTRARSAGGRRAGLLGCGTTADRADVGAGTATVRAVVAEEVITVGIGGHFVGIFRVGGS